MDNNIEKQLFDMADKKYRDFQAKLIPNIEKSTIIGVRTPALRSLAKEYSKLPESIEFMKDLPHEYFDENVLHGLLINCMKDYDKAVEQVDLFLPYVDNWAACDLLSPKVFKKHRDRLYPEIKNGYHQTSRLL